MKRFTSSAFLLGCIVFLPFLATAQSSTKKPIEKPGPISGLRVADIASHNDHPQLAYRQNWNAGNSAWDDIAQWTYAYTANGQVAELITAAYFSGTYNNSTRNLYGYDADGNMGLNLSFNWLGNNWEEYSRSTYEYDVHGNQTLSCTELWNGFNFDTSYAYRTIFTYINTDMKETATYMSWDQFSFPHWENDYLKEYHYNANDLLDSLTTSGWSSNTWVPWDKEAYAWNSNNEWDTVTTFSWTGAAWTPIGREVDYQWHDFSLRYYDSFRTQAMAGQWVDQSRNTRTYTATDGYTDIEESWTGSSWDSTSMEILDFDAEHHLTVNEIHSYNSGWSIFFGFHLFYTYDSQDRVTEYYTQAHNGSNYVNGEKWIYSNFFTGQAESQTPLVAVTTYPNPVSETLHIEFETAPAGAVHIALHDLQGRLRMESQVRSLAGREMTMPISEVLENGTYVYTIHTAQGHSKGRVVVQK